MDRLCSELLLISVELRDCVKLMRNATLASCTEQQCYASFFFCDAISTPICVSYVHIFLSFPNLPPTRPQSQSQKLHGAAQTEPPQLARLVKHGLVHPLFRYQRQRCNWP